MAGWIVWKGHVPPNITISSLPRHQRFLDLNYNREIREAGRSGRLRTRSQGERETGRSEKDGAERPGRSGVSPRAYSLFFSFPGFTAVFTKWLEKSGGS